MNILQVTLGFLPANAWGGPVKIVHQNAKELVRRGHSVTIYCSNLLDKRNKIKPGTFEREIDGIRVVYFDTWHLPFWPGTAGPMWLPEMGVYLDREAASYDVFHLHGYRNLMLLPATRAAKKAGIPVIMQPHGAMPVIVNSLQVKRFYDLTLGRWELEGLAGLVAAQPRERCHARAMGVADDLIVEIANGLVVPDQGSLPPRGWFRHQHGLPPDRPLVLFLGRINHKKGPDMLVQAFSCMTDPEPMLVMAGSDDGQLAEVTRLVKTLHLQDRVVFTGLLAGRDVWAALRDADLFVLPCRRDTFPMAIVEACAMGLPILTTTGCEISHLVDGQIGEVVSFDPDQFAQAMERLLSDSTLRQRYADNTQMMMDQVFSMRAIGDQLEQLYEAVVDGRSPN
jgi:glycosyltransferase involved in cell wall biosynthesis